MALVSLPPKDGPLLPLTKPPSDALSALSAANHRKSGILSPTVVVTGHEGEVLCLDFSPDGRNFASGSVDRNIFIYRVYGECQNWCVLKGHQNAVLELHWSKDGSTLYSCSADKSCAVWDVEEGQRIKKLSGHQQIVNSCSPSRRGPPLLVSGADDGTTKVWDLRSRRCVKTFEHQYQILAVSFDDVSERIFAGSIDNCIRVYNLRKGAEEGVLEGHTDSVTGVDLSKDGSYLLSNSMDQTVRMWDIRPFFAGDHRCIGVLRGATHNFEKNLLKVRWSADDSMCAAGSADRYVYVWSTQDKRPLLYKLPGHAGSVNEVVFHPTEPVIASGASDKKIFLGELGE